MSAEWMADVNELEKNINGICFYEQGSSKEGVIILSRNGLPGMVLAYVNLT